MTSLQKGKAVLSKTEKLSEKFETAFDPLIFGKDYFLWFSEDTLMFARFGIVFWSNIGSI